MSGVLRTFACQNGDCGCEFDAWEAHPACPSCGCVRVGWVPRKISVATDHAYGAAALDAELKNLVDVFGLTNLKSAREGEAAKVMAQASGRNSGPPVQFAPGFAAPIGESATCTPSTQKVDFKVTAEVGKAVSRIGMFSDVSANTQFTHRHVPGAEPSAPLGRAPKPARATGRFGP